jgi:hypothetical protein
VKRLTTLFALVMIVASCGGPPPEPPAPPPLDPTGSFSVSVDVQGQMVSGTMVIRETQSGYSGSIDTDMGGAAMSNVMVAGNTVTFDLPDVGVSVEIIFEGEGFSGTFDGAMGAGAISGVRR